MDFSGRDRLHYVTLDDLPDQRVRWWGGVAPVDRLLGARIHGFTTIVRVRRGTGRLEGSFGTVPMTAGDVVIVPPGRIAYRFSTARDVEVIPSSQPWDDGWVAREDDELTRAFDGGTAALYDALERSRRRAVTRFERRSAEQTITAALARLSAAPGTARAGTVAGALGYTGDALARLLRRETGRSFADWRTALAMAAARRLIAGGVPTATVARTLGLDESYTYRRFARAHGTTPARWRETLHLPDGAAVYDWAELRRAFDPGVPPGFSMPYAR